MRTASIHFDFLNVLTHFNPIFNLSFQAHTHHQQHNNHQSPPFQTTPQKLQQSKTQKIYQSKTQKQQSIKTQKQSYLKTQKQQNLKTQKPSYIKTQKSLSFIIVPQQAHVPQQLFKCKSICPIFNHKQSSYILVQGQNLWDYYKSNQINSVIFAEQQILIFMKQILEALIKLSQFGLTHTHFKEYAIYRNGPQSYQLLYHPAIRSVMQLASSGQYYWYDFYLSPQELSIIKDRKKQQIPKINTNIKMSQYAQEIIDESMPLSQQLELDDKQSTFCLGMMVLNMMNLQQFNRQVYNKQTMSIQWGIVDDKLRESCRKYSSKLVQLVGNCLQKQKSMRLGMRAVYREVLRRQDENALVGDKFRVRVDLLLTKMFEGNRNKNKNKILQNDESSGFSLINKQQWQKTNSKKSKSKGKTKSRSMSKQRVTQGFIEKQQLKYQQQQRLILIKVKNNKQIQIENTQNPQQSYQQSKSKYCLRNNEEQKQRDPEQYKQINLESQAIIFQGEQVIDFDRGTFGGQQFQMRNHKNYLNVENKNRHNRNNNKNNKNIKDNNIQDNDIDRDKLRDEKNYIRIERENSNQSDDDLQQSENDQQQRRVKNKSQYIEISSKSNPKRVDLHYKDQKQQQQFNLQEEHYQTHKNQQQIRTKCINKQQQSQLQTQPKNKPQYIQKNIINNTINNTINKPNKQTLPITSPSNSSNMFSTQSTKPYQYTNQPYQYTNQQQHLTIQQQRTPTNYKNYCSVQQLKQISDSYQNLHQQLQTIKNNLQHLLQPLTLSLQLTLKPIPTLINHLPIKTAVFVQGNLYYGPFKNGRRNGFGLEIFPENQYYFGNFQDDLFHGQGFYFWNKNQYFLGLFENGSKTFGNLISPKINYTGQFKNSKKMNGIGISKLKTGQTYTGYWKQGKKHGLGQIIEITNDKFIGHWQNGKKSGYGEYLINNFPQDGLKIKAIWFKNDLISDTIVQYSNGNQYEGPLHEFEKHGKGVYKFKKGGYFKGTFYKDNPTHGQLLYRNGQKYIGSLRNMKRHGFGEYHYCDGTIKKGNWIDDVRVQKDPFF